MGRGTLARLRAAIIEYFPERHLYVRSAGEIHTFVFSTTRQIQIAALVAFCALWMGVTTAAMTVNALSDSKVDRAVAMEKARAERRIADREARLNSAVAQLSDTNGLTEQLAMAVEKRQAALATLMEQAGLSTPEEVIDLATTTADDNAVARIQMASANTDRLLDEAENRSRTRSERLQTALRLAGLNPAAYAPSESGLGGPLIDAGDPGALAAILDVDEAFARRIQTVASDLSSISVMDQQAAKLPLGEPTTGTRRSSGFGARLDPFTRAPAMHSGLDFAGPLRTPIYSTGPGVVSYVGPRSGYGTVVEIDHGGGYKTRYAHLSSANVRVGERVDLGQRVAAMGSTGRSTGTHLHYEVWVNGRAQNPDRFLRAGNYVQQAE